MKNMRNGVLNNKTDVKIFILFLLNHVRYPLPYDDICVLIGEDGFVADFDFAECFSELCEMGHIEESESEGVKCYVISDMGKEVAASLEDTLLSSIRKKSLHSAMRYLSLRHRGAHASASIERREDKQYTVSCRVEEKEGVYASFSLTLPTEEEAQRIRRHFLDKPEEVLRGITAAATGELEYLLGSSDGF